jgi:ribosome-associated translation inhibitor RaiA
MVNMANNAIITLPPEEMKKLVRVLRNTSVNERNSVFLSLDLGELGEVKLDVKLKGKNVFIKATVNDRRAGAALSMAIGELKKQLATIQLELESFEIKVGRQLHRNDKDTNISAHVFLGQR